MPIKEFLSSVASRFEPYFNPGSMSRREVLQRLGLGVAVTAGVGTSLAQEGCASKPQLASELPQNKEITDRLRSELGIKGSTDFASMITPLREKTIGSPLWGINKNFGSIFTPTDKSLSLTTDAKGEPFHPDVKKSFDYQRPDSVRSDEIKDGDGKMKCIIYGTSETIGRMKSKAEIVKKFMAEYFTDAQDTAENVLILNFLPADQTVNISAYNLQIGGLKGPRARTRIGRMIKDGNYTNVVRNIVLLNLHINSLFASDDGFSTQEALTASLANEKTNWAVENSVKGRDRNGRLVHNGVPYTPDTPQSETPSTLMGYLALLDPEVAKQMLGPSYLDFLNMVSKEMELMKRNISIADTFDTDKGEVREISRRKFVLTPIFMALDRMTQVIPFISDPRLPTERVILQS